MDNEANEEDALSERPTAVWGPRLLKLAFALAAILGAMALSPMRGLVRPWGAIPLLLLGVSWLVRIVEEDGGPIMRLLGRSKRARDWVIARRMRRARDELLQRPSDFSEATDELPEEDGRACVLARVLADEGQREGDIAASAGQEASFIVLVDGKKLAVETDALRVHLFDDIRVGETLELEAELDVPNDAPDEGAFRSGARLARTRGPVEVHIVSRHDDRLPPTVPTDTSAYAEDMALPAPRYYDANDPLATSRRVSDGSYPWLAHLMCLVVGVPALMTVSPVATAVAFTFMAIVSLSLLLPGLAARHNIGKRTSPNRKTSAVPIASSTGWQTIEGYVRELGSVTSDREFFWREYAIEDSSGILLVTEATNLAKGQSTLRDGDRVRASVRIATTKRAAPNSLNRNKPRRVTRGPVQIDKVLKSASRVRVASKSKRKDREMLNGKGRSRDEARREARQQKRRAKKQRGRRRR